MTCVLELFERADVVELDDNIELDARRHVGALVLVELWRELTTIRRVIIKALSKKD